MNRFFTIPYKNNGRDFNGCDCYGLVKLMCSELDDIELPDFIYEDSSRENGHIYNKELTNKRWAKCEPKKGAIALLRIEGVAKHVGYMIDSTKFMHILGEAGVNIVSIKDTLFKNRIVGFWEYKA